MIPDYWTNCYDMNWKNLITPAAFSHPAKFSHGLIKHIYDHALQDGLIQPGGVVLDPFGGVGLGALYAMQNGLHWVGCELEPRFVELARENIALWNARYAAHFPNWGTAQILAGDSRRLCEVVAAAGLVVSSPPYADGGLAHNNADYAPGKLAHKKAIGATDKRATWGNNAASAGSSDYGSAPGQLGNLPPGDFSAVISSPPFAGNTGGRGEASRNGIDAALFDRHSGGMKKGTGDDPANLDHLPQGTPPMAIVSSPPYADGGVAHNDRDYAPGKIEQAKAIGATANRATWGHNKGSSGQVDYGSAPGQLGAMKPGEISAVIASPPYVDSMEKSGGIDPAKSNHIGGPHSQMNRSDTRYGETEGQLGAMKAGAAVIGSPPFSPGQSTGGEAPKFLDGKPRSNNGIGHNYGSDPDQLGNAAPDTFWAAAKTIIDQCYQILPPNAYAIWVVKNYIKAGREVDFTGQWQALCEACGFETVHIHRAMLVKENGEQETMAAGHDTTGTTTNLLGEEVTTAGKALANKKNRTERKSFFRRLHERRRPDLAIDFETVLCMRKPASP